MITTNAYNKFKDHYFNTLAEQIGKSDSKMFFDDLSGVLSVTNGKWTLIATPGWNGDDNIPVDVCDGNTGDVVYSNTVKMNITGDLTSDVSEYIKVMSPYLTIFFSASDVVGCFQALNLIEYNCKKSL